MSLRQLRRLRQQLKGSTLFEVFYSSFGIILALCCLGLLIITPADAIRQTIDNQQKYNISVIAGCYAFTIFIALILLILRISTERAVLGSIPKTWIPIEKDDVSKKVRKMIVASLNKSAAIAWDSRPRLESLPATAAYDADTNDPIVRLVSTEINSRKEHAVLHKRQAEEVDNEDRSVTNSSKAPTWGIIAHDGWSSPTSSDLPNLQYNTVILELPHLIEAKAVSVVPPDPDPTSSPGVPDIRALELLQRPTSLGLRDYISHLKEFNVISDFRNASDFLNSYEYARFSSQPLTEIEFRDLMKKFAELLRSMQPLSPAILASLSRHSMESDADDDNSFSSPPITPRSRSPTSSHTATSRSESEGTVHTAPSRHLGTSVASTRRFPEFSTAPATPRSRRHITSRSPSSNTFSQSRRPYNGDSGSSSTSLASSQGSVIRLNLPMEEGSLPYTLMIPGAR